VIPQIAPLLRLLTDVNVPEGEGVAKFEESRWFQRGWTLQELIAPRNILFYDHSWCFIGMRQTSGDHPEALVDVAETISKTSGIPVTLLCWYYYTRIRPTPGVRDALMTYPGPRPGRFDVNTESGRDPTDPRSVTFRPTDGQATSQLLDALRSFGVAQKMSWASRRRTTRLEDEAYSLLGLFEVNMPMLYGEGRRAFFRLQQEILKASNDQSILAFAYPPEGLVGDDLADGSPLLASSPRCFAVSLITQPQGFGPFWPGAPRVGPELSPFPKLLEIGLCLCPQMAGSPMLKYQNRIYLGILDCEYQDDYTSHPAIVLEALDEQDHPMFKRARGDLLRITPLDLTYTGRKRPIEGERYLPILRAHSGNATG
jgi:hypothetical protein